MTGGRNFFRPLARIAALALAAAMLTFAPAAVAKTYKPTKTGEGAAGGLTLREAVIAANARPGADRIVLKPGKTYKLALAGVETDGAPPEPTSGDLDIRDPSNSSLTILSPGPRLATVNAQGIDRVFDCWTACKFTRLKIRGGNTSVSGDDGGGINSEFGRITVKLSRIVGNFSDSQGGGISSDDGGLAISRSVISGNRVAANGGGENGGGGIETGDGPTSISKSTIEKNVSESGAGGISNENPLTIKNSTISFNQSLNGGGGGIQHGDDLLNLVNSTIANNSAFGPNAPGGGVLSQGVGSVVVALNGATIARNTSTTSGGGIRVFSGSLVPRNSIIALNGAPVGPDCNSNPGIVTSFGQNLIGSNAGCLTFSAASGDFVNLSSSQIGIKTLKSNGGPTKTIALKQSSKAVNNAGSDIPKRDQRGVKRKNPDIGAFELR
jgi:hypothetical protein